MATKVLILGGGFSGFFTARHLKKLLKDKVAVIAYLSNIHGEQTMYDFWINSQSGILFPENFQNTFGKDYITYEKEFRNFITNSSEDELMSILPNK